MLSELLEKASLFHILHHIDTDLCKQLRQKGCPYCDGPLHQSNYERKPRGGPDNIPDEYLIRQSLCCGRPECRRRALPQSCLFMGRRVYWGCVILVIITLKQNRPDSASARRIQEKFEISRQTLKRWMDYFRDEFPESLQWQRLRGRLASMVSNNKLPAELVHHFLKNFPSPQQALIGCLQFLASEPSGSLASCGADCVTQNSDVAFYRLKLILAVPESGELFLSQQSQITRKEPQPWI